MEDRSLRKAYTRMRDPVKRKEQLLAEYLGNKGLGGARGQITED